MKSVNEFELHLKKEGLSKNTVSAYLFAINYFRANYELNLESILEYKGYLIEKFKPKTVNLRIQAINSYLKFIGKEDLCLRALKIQQKNFLENVISYADYLFLKKALKKEENEPTP